MLSEPAVRVHADAETKSEEGTMTISIHTLIPDADALLALEPEELAGFVMEHLNSIEDKKTLYELSRYNFSMVNTVKGYPPERYDELRNALMEAWVWLEREGLLAPKPGRDADFVFITRRGKKMTRHEDVEAYGKANLLPKKFLHPRIGHKIWAAFLRGDFDVAVLQVFKEVEVAVRSAGGFKDEDHGMQLMQSAFHPEDGPLTDKTLPKAERLGLMFLFSGAIGRYKNPHSHRHVGPIEPSEAAEIIILASHLLRIVDSREPSEANSVPG